VQGIITSQDQLGYHCLTNPSREPLPDEKRQVHTANSNPIALTGQVVSAGANVP